MKKTLLTVVSLALVAAGVSLAADGRDPSRVKTAPASIAGTHPPPAIENVNVTIQYDPGGPQDLFVALAGNIDVYGNVFSSHLGGPLKSGTITAVSFFPVDGGAGGDFTVSFMSAPAGATAALYQYINFTGVVNSTFNSGAVSGGQTVASSFLVAGYLGTFNGPDQLGARTASYASQGFHAFQGDFLGAATVGSISAVPGQNAMLRVSGNMGVPVELMNFAIE